MKNNIKFCNNISCINFFNTICMYNNKFIIKKGKKIFRIRAMFITYIASIEKYYVVNCWLIKNNSLN